MNSSVELLLLIQRFFPQSLPLFTPRATESGRLFVPPGFIFACPSFFVTFSPPRPPALHSTPPPMHISPGCVKLLRALQAR